MENGFQIIIGIAVVIGAVLLFLWWYLLRLRSQAAGPKALDSVFLQILMPKHSEQKGEEGGRAGEKELIGVAEQLFATLAGFQKKRLSDFWTGGESVSLEIICSGKKIYFYIVCPRHLHDLVEKQIHAQYPEAQIDETAPPRLFQGGKEVAARELRLLKKFHYPVKTYKMMESDPLNALTNSLSKLGENEAGAIQLVIQPAGTAWRREVSQTARAIHRGEHVDDSSSVGLRVLGGAGKVLGDVFNEVSGAKKSQQDMYRRGSDGQMEMRPLTPMQQEQVKRLEEKASKAAFRVNLRCLVAGASRESADAHLRNILSSFMQYNQPPFNGFSVGRKMKSRVARDYLYRRFESQLFNPMILNTEELASIFHPPTRFIETPNVKWLEAKRSPAPVDMPEEGILLGINTYRGVSTEVRIADEDRRRHMHIVGRTGTGKSQFMINMAIQDVRAGKGVAIIDPHGELVEDILEHIPKERAEDVILFEPFDTERPMALNMLEARTEEEEDFAVQEMIAIFYKLFPPEMMGPVFEHNMRNVMLTLMADRDAPGTIAEIPRMFTDPDFQRYKLTKVHDPVVRAFWEQEMAKTSDFHKSEMLGYLISKVGRFVENEMMRNIIGQSRSAFDVRDVMDSGKILLVNLSKGRTGEINSKLLGLIIVSKLQMAALSRADVAEHKRPDFYVYIDEFQNFVTDSIATILSEARKYHLNLTMAHQYISQLVQQNDTRIRDAVFGNVGTLVAFRVGVEDAEVLAKEFKPVFNEFDVINIEQYNAYVKLMVKGTASRPFNMKTIAPSHDGNIETAEAVSRLSKLKYTRPKAEVEKEIMYRSNLGNTNPGISVTERTL